jgi:hypothetical protein
MLCRFASIAAFNCSDCADLAAGGAHLLAAHVTKTLHFTPDAPGFVSQAVSASACQNST